MNRAASSVLLAVLVLAPSASGALEAETKAVAPATSRPKAGLPKQTPAAKKPTSGAAAAAKGDTKDEHLRARGEGTGKNRAARRQRTENKHKAVEAAPKAATPKTSTAKTPAPKTAVPKATDPSTAAASEKTTPPQTAPPETGSARVIDEVIKPGDRITKANLDNATSLVSPGVRWCIANGMELEIVPYRHVPVPRNYQEATEKYSSQVRLAPNHTLTNFVAGKPFPVIDVDDPTAAVKVMHNFQHSHYYTDSLDLHLADADTGALSIDADNKRRYTVERHFVPEWLRSLRFNGRLASAPNYTLEPNGDKTWQKAGLYPLIEPFDLKGVGGVAFRYLDPGRQDDTWLYIPSIRRVRRLSSAQRSDALFGQDIDVDSYGGYAGQIPWFTWKLLGVQPALQSMHGENMPPKLCTADGGLTFCEPWELRPEVYVIEGRSKQQGYAYSKRIIYVEKESNLISVSDLYDSNEELWKTVMLSFRVDKKPNPKVDFSYDIERMFVYAYTVVDMQLQHGTRVSIPGRAFQNDPGWFLDLGFDAPTAAPEEWFSIPALVRSGR